MLLWSLWAGPLPQLDDAHASIITRILPKSSRSLPKTAYSAPPIVLR